MGREWLDVPYADKDQAKSLGAWWDDEARRWYAPRPGMRQLARWAARPDLPALLPGEDRAFGDGLFVDLIPETCWFESARANIAPRDWERVRRLVTGRASRRCEVPGCRRAEDRRLGILLEAHERWEYQAGKQVLRRLICLCTRCHEATHFGLAGLRGRDTRAFSHLCAVTGMSAREADQHIQAAFATWEKRSAVRWELDLSILTRAGIALARPASVPAPRRAAWPDVDMRGHVAAG
jgi:hypothetical protein